MTSNGPIVPVGRIESSILLIRGEKVILDADLAGFYGVSTGRLNEQVKRNADRFPDDFMFRLNQVEKTEVIAKCDHLQKLKYSRVLPNAFTEHGALMASSVLKTPMAVEVSIFIVRAFKRLRELVAGQKELQNKIADIETRLTEHDEAIVELLELIKKFLESDPLPEKRRIGF